MTRRLAFAVALGAAALGSGIGLTAIAAWLLATAAAQPPVLTLMVAVVAVRTFGISKGVLRYLERLVSHDVAFRALARQRQRVYAKLTRLAPAGLAAFRRGELLTGLVDDVAAVQDRYARVLVPAASAAVAALLAGVIAAALLPVAALILLAGLAIHAIVAPRLMVVLTGSADRRLADGRAESSAALVETLDGVEELRVLGALPDRVAAAERLAGRVAAAETRLAWTRGLSGALGTVTIGMTVVATLLVAAPAVRDGSLDGPAFAVLILLPLAAFDAMAGLATALRDREHVKASDRRIDAVLAAPVPMAEPAEPRAPVGHAITVRGLRARWPGAGHDSLHGIDLDLPTGARLAIVGASGSGKSTLLAALLRFCPASGRIEIGGVPLSAVPESKLRKLIGLAAADAHVFDSTIAANLRVARPDATDAELRSVLARAGLLGWVDSLPRALDTPVGQHGAKLSGGQRQRLALARALLADVPVLLCDEPDASLDPALANQLVADLVTAAGHRTVVIVTHRPASLVDVDRVLVLEDGRMADCPDPVSVIPAPIAASQYDRRHG